MDARVTSLLDELAALPTDQPLDFAGHWHGRFQKLFDERMDGESRGKLLESYAALLDQIDVSLLEQGLDAEPFREARKEDWYALCVQEARFRSNSEVVNPADVFEIVQREIGCGRMAGGEAESPGKAKRGLFRRIFG